jgi:hypothetical protein
MLQKGDGLGATACPERRRDSNAPAPTKRRMKAGGGRMKKMKGLLSRMSKLRDGEAMIPKLKFQI